MKYCPKCDDSKPDNLKFCTKCGSMLKTLVEADSEGKQAKKETVKTAQKASEVTGEMKYAGFFQRFFAAFFDGIILFIIASVFSKAIGPLIILIQIFYYVYFIGSSGQTPGKKLMKIKVCRENGERVGYGKAFVRYIGYIFSAIVLGLGFALIIFDSKKQGLHDKLAGTYVVRV